MSLSPKLSTRPITLSRKIFNSDSSRDKFGSRTKESDSRVGPKHTDSTRGLSSKAKTLDPTREFGLNMADSDSTRGHPIALYHEKS